MIKGNEVLTKISPFEAKWGTSHRMWEMYLNFVNGILLILIG